MTLFSISSESIQGLYDETLALMQPASSSWISSTLCIDLVEGNWEKSPGWPTAFEAMKKTAELTKELLNEMGFKPSKLQGLINNILKQRSVCVYNFTHSKDFIENPSLLKTHLLAQIEKDKPFSPAVLASLLFVAATAGKYTNVFQKSVLAPPTSQEKTVAIQAYRTGSAFRCIIDQIQSGADIRSEGFKKDLCLTLAQFVRELTLYYQSLELLTRPSANPLLETQ